MILCSAMVLVLLVIIIHTMVEKIIKIFHNTPMEYMENQEVDEERTREGRNSQQEEYQYRLGLNHPLSVMKFRAFLWIENVTTIVRELFFITDRKSLFCSRIHSECRCRQDEHLVLPVLDPPEQLVDGRDDLQLGGGGTEGGVELEGLGDPAQDGLLLSLMVAEFDLLVGRAQQAALQGEVDRLQPPLVLPQLVAGAVHRGDVLGRGPGLVEEMSHLSYLDTLAAEVDRLQGGGDVL